MLRAASEAVQAFEYRPQGVGSSWARTFGLWVTVGYETRPITLKSAVTYYTKAMGGPEGWTILFLETWERGHVRVDIPEHGAYLECMEVRP